MSPYMSDPGISLVRADEAYTTIVWSGLLSRESYKLVGAETVEIVEGYMLRTGMRGVYRPAVVGDPITHEWNTSEPGRPLAAHSHQGDPGSDREGDEP